MSLTAGTYPSSHTLAFANYMAPFTPLSFGRPSSPLNPHSGSSSPLTSPTPGDDYPYAMHQLYPDLPDSSRAGPSRPPRVARQLSLPFSPSATPGAGAGARHGRRPTAPTRHCSSLPGSTAPQDLFTEGSSPVQSQMWRDRLGRRMEERERRKRVREADRDKRRDVVTEDRSEAAQEAADRQAQEDDEEIFRRVMVLQRRKAQHAALVSHEVETGGSDPLLPDFWEDELYQLAANESDLITHTSGPDHPPSIGSSRTSPTFPRQPVANALYQDHSPYRDATIPEGEDEWTEEAAAAEEAEREAEELALLDRVEREYGMPMQNGGGAGLASGGMGSEMDIEWDEFDWMDMEE